MQDFLFVNFFLGHERGEEARRLLRACHLLEIATKDRANRHAWLEDVHLGVSLRLPFKDIRLTVLLDRLRKRGVDPFLRVDREYSRQELDQAEWLILRTATAGLLGGVDYGQTYMFKKACMTCGSGAIPIAPLIAQLGKMGKKDIDQLIYEGHLIASARVADELAHLTGLELEPVRSPRRPRDSRFRWLRINSSFPRMHHSTSGIVTENVCPTCERAGHFGQLTQPIALAYKEIPRTASDFNHTCEYFGDWQQVRSNTHTRPVGCSRENIVSQRVRQTLCRLNVGRLVWAPVTVLQ